MKRVAVFGNAGGGKSTLARRLSELTNLPLYPVDVLQYRAGGGKTPHDDYLKAHADLVRREAWIIDGYGCVAVDLPLFTHYLWVTKRLVKGLFRNPEGWPDNSPMWSSTLDGYRVIPLCHRHLTPKYRRLVAESAAAKRVHHLRSPRQMRAFVDAVERECR
jgi:hypothetical protein